MRSVLLTSIVLSLGLGGFDAPTAHAGGSKADYKRAAAMAGRLRGKVRNEHVSGMWADKNTLLFKLTEAGGTWQFMRVDARTGSREPAFDHAAVAKALESNAGVGFKPERLSITPIDMEDDELRVQHKARVFGINAKTNAVREIDLATVASLRLRPTRLRKSSGGGDDTAILFVNRSGQSVQLIWLDHEGREKAYGSVAAGESSRQHTFPGHVWRVRGADGTNYGAYVGRRSPGAAIITDPPNLPKKGTPARRPGAARSPDGKHVAFIRDHNVFVRKHPNGPERQLSTDGTAEDAYTGRWMWSRDSRYLMVVQQKPAQSRTVHIIDSAPDRGVQPKLESYPYLKPGDRIAQPRPRLFDVRKGKPIEIPDALFDTPWSINHFSWSEDNKRFRFLYHQRGHKVSRMIELDAAKATATALFSEAAGTFIDYSQKTYLRSLNKGREWIWMSERSGYNHLYRINPKKGRADPITSGDWVVRRVQYLDQEQGTLRFEAMGVFPDQDPYHVHVGRVDLDGKNLVWLTRGDGTHTITFSPDRAHYVDRYSRADLAPVYELRRTKDGELISELARGDTSALKDLGWSAPEVFQAPGRDGETPIWGLIHRPTSFDPDKQYPVIEAIYAGPHGHHVPKGFRTWSGPRSMAELGFIVVQIDGMGTNWRRKAFHDVCWQNLGDAGLPDRIAWMRAAAKTRPFMDLERVGIYGGSAGGQNALGALLFHPDFYKVAVADCGCHDNRTDKIWWNEAWMGWPVGPHYAEQSNVTNANKLQGKLLLIVGELDRNVDPASTMQVVDALIKADKDFDLLVMPGVGHGAAGTPYGRRRQADFFVRHLLGVEPRGR